MSGLYLSNEVKVSIRKSCINKKINQKDINLVMMMSYSSCIGRNPIITYCWDTALRLLQSSPI